MRVTRLRCEHLRDPMGIDEPAPRLSWDIESDRPGARQVAYQVVADGWDSGRVESDRTELVEWGGGRLTSTQRVRWRVRVWDDVGRMAESDGASWEMGLLEPSDWLACWIGRPASWEGGPGRPTPRFRRAFRLDAPAERARLYITALGLYEAHCNGERVGRDRFTPGWTDYRKRVQYQTYDVTRMLRSGENLLEVELADGWYAGWVGFVGGREHYGAEPELLAQLVVEHPGGPTRVVTDETWEVATGPRLEADLLMGERFDARVVASPWERARLTAGTSAALVAPGAPSTRAVEEVAQVSTTPRDGRRIVDFGQNLVGWARVRATGPAGAVITLRFAEVLDDDGALYVDNLRSARATDTFVLAGAGRTEAFEPSFTFHGFRYAEVDAPPEVIDTVELTAVVCHADLEPAGDFRCSDPLVNQLQQNIRWGMRGNFVEVPTDCPQRDERLGWMGDAQVFAPTACFNYDVAAFLSKWMTDVVDGQTDEGGFPDVAPRVVDPQDGAPGWGDAGVIVPWVLWERYADRRLLERCFDAMAAWVDYIAQANPGRLWLERRNGDMGDWLSVEADSPKDVVATAYFARSAELVARAAEVVGRRDAAARYGDLAAEVCDAFVKAYVDEEGRVAGGTQTVYALALRFGLLPPRLRAPAAGHLVADVAARGFHLSTGFLGVAHLLPALSDHGHADVAYRLLHQDTWPSWLYPVRHGATTIWERWDGWTEERGFQDPAMNSFNHYAFGAVGEWLYEYVAGLRPDPTLPGYRRAIVEPHLGGGLEWAEASHRGFAVRWERRGSEFELALTVPAGRSAVVRLPDGRNETAFAGAHRYAGEC